MRQAGPPATPPRTLARPRSFDAWLARRSPGRDRASPRPRPAAGAPRPGRAARPRRARRRARRSASSSGRRIPNYDSYYSLLWGREVLHGTLPSFDGLPRPDRAPARDRLRRAARARSATTPTASWSARRSRRSWSSPRACTGSRRRRSRRSSGSSRPRCSARASTSRSSPRAAYIDIPYLALVVWAVALEARAPAPRDRSSSCCSPRPGCCARRHGCSAGCTGCGASCARPGAQRIRYAALTAVGPIVWCAVDWIVTGDPLFSLTQTTGPRRGARARPGGLSAIPAATVAFLAEPRQGAGLLRGARSAWCSRSCSSPRRVG